MNDEMLEKVANAILRSLKGPGEWKGFRKDFEPIKDPLQGLAVGDLVYSYNEDDVRIDEEQVIAVVDGIGYVLFASRNYAPGLLPVSRGCYGRTIAEAVELSREQLESDVKYCQRMADSLQSIKSLLGQ